MITPNEKLNANAKEKELSKDEQDLFNKATSNIDRYLLENSSYSVPFVQFSSIVCTENSRAGLVLDRIMAAYRNVGWRVVVESNPPGGPEYIQFDVRRQRRTK